MDLCEESCYLMHSVALDLASCLYISEWNMIDDHAPKPFKPGGAECFI